jgi:hypothetical protein
MDRLQIQQRMLELEAEHKTASTDRCFDRPDLDKEVKVSQRAIVEAEWIQLNGALRGGTLPDCMLDSTTLRDLIARDDEATDIADKAVAEWTRQSAEETAAVNTSFEKRVQAEMAPPPIWGE